MTLFYLNAVWGLWLIGSGFSHGYADPRMLWSDVICGALLIALIPLGAKSQARSNWGIRTAAGSVGIWLLLSPLVFWSPNPAAYSSNTLVGCLVFFSSLFLPSYLHRNGSGLPPRWSYNPSEWSQRVPILLLALSGFLVARYLAAFQLGHTESVWEPFFGDGTAKTLTSDVSRAFPVSDAGLGAFAYLIDALTGSIGDRRRWKTMPWMVIVFGIMIVPPGITSITLVILQPVAVGAWCTLCLVSAVITLLMVPPAIDEVVASVQFLAESRRQGLPFWKTFWKGAPHGLTAPEVREGARVVPGPGPRRRFPYVPSHLLLITAIGAWILFAPEILHIERPISTQQYIIGALIITIAIVSMSEVARAIRFAVVPLALWLAITSVGLPDVPQRASIGAALALFILCLPKGAIRRKYGAYDRWVHWRPFSDRAA